MFGNFLKQPIYIIKLIKTKNEFGEYVYNEQEIETKGFVNVKRTKILHEQKGIIEEINYECFIPADLEITKVDKIKWNNNIFEIKSILPVVEFSGNVRYKVLLLKKKE